RLDQLGLAHPRTADDALAGGALHQLVALEAFQWAARGAACRTAALTGRRGAPGGILAITGLGRRALVLAGTTLLLATAALLVDGGPGARLGLRRSHALLLVAFLDMGGLALLLFAVLVFVSAWHGRFLQFARVHGL